MRRDEILPPCSRMIFCETGKPSPVPREPLLEAKIWKIEWDIVLRRCRRPLSLTVMRAIGVSASHSVLTTTWAFSAPSQASMALVTMFETARWMPSGSIVTRGMSSPGCQLSLTPSSVATRLHELDDVADGLVQVGRLERGLAILGEREHVHDHVVDLGLVFLDDRPAPADDGVVLFLESQVDQRAAAVDALEDVLDVMGEGGDRLADRGESFGLDLVVVEDGVFDGQSGLVADGDHQRELLLAEPAARPGLAAARLGRASGLDVGVDDAQGGVPSLNRHADGLADL